MKGSEIKKVAVVGTGFMGTGIAQVTAMANMEVVIHDDRPEAMSKALETIRWSLDRLKSKGVFEGETEAILARIHPSRNLEDTVDADLLIEAVFESIPVKEKLFEQLGERIDPGAVIGSNTSSIPMDTLSRMVHGPERFLGTHFFGPVPLMKLVELVTGPETSEITLDRTRKFMKRIGKIPIVVRKPSPGFLVNRIFMAAALEAMRCYFEGVGTPEDIDTGMRLGYGWTAGPFEVMDHAGLDIMAGIFEVMGGEAPPRILEMLEKGHLGRKTGQGFYRYGPEGKKIQEE